MAYTKIKNCSTVKQERKTAYNYLQLQYLINENIVSNAHVKSLKYIYIYIVKRLFLKPTFQNVSCNYIYKSMNEICHKKRKDKSKIKKHFFSEINNTFTNL